MALQPACESAGLRKGSKKKNKKVFDVGNNGHFANRGCYVKSVTPGFASSVCNRNMKGEHGILFYILCMYMMCISIEVLNSM